ncbi:hypothetical protein HDV00_006250 [Rhizophlyctis rosea]|nr:hypothetical protein HDV00_006250 [Rhizophlyctis rosea]
MEAAVLEASFMSHARRRSQMIDMQDLDDVPVHGTSSAPVNAGTLSKPPNAYTGTLTKPVSEPTETASFRGLEFPTPPTSDSSLPRIPSTETAPPNKAREALSATYKKCHDKVFGLVWDAKYWQKTHRKQSKYIAIGIAIFLALIVIIGAALGAKHGRDQQQQTTSADHIQSAETDGTVGIQSADGDNGGGSGSDASNPSFNATMNGNGTFTNSTTNSTLSASASTTTTVVSQPTTSSNSNNNNDNNKSSSGSSSSSSDNNSQPQWSSSQPDCLSGQNSYRSSYGLPRLSYSKSLESYACNFARKLIYENDLYHSGGPYGENLWRSSGSDMSGDYNSCSGAVGSWAYEKRNYRSGLKIGQGLGVINYGHWTQMMWRDSRQVGCCRAANSDRTVVIWACEYSPKGNMDGEAAY